MDPRRESAEDDDAGLDLESEESRHRDSLDSDGEDHADPKREARVPLDRAEQMATRAAERAREEMRAELAKLEGRIEELTRGRDPAPKTEPTYTREQLANLVMNGQVSQEQADDLYDRQREKQLEERLEKRVKDTLETDRRMSSVQTSIGDYAAKVPNLLVPGTPERTRVENEYRYLIEIGMPASTETELVALRTVYGDPKNLKGAGEMARDTHQETSAGGGGDDRDSRDVAATDRPPKDLTRDERAYYQDLIRKGIYSGWKEVHKEMKFADKRLRARHGATT